MNSNEIFIFIIGIISIPICLILLYIMPNAKICNSCGTHLSVHKHDSYFLKNTSGEKLEVCKNVLKQDVFIEILMIMQFLPLSFYQRKN